MAATRSRIVGREPPAEDPSEARMPQEGSQAMRIACSDERVPLSYAHYFLPSRTMTARRLVPFVFFGCVLAASLADCGGNNLGTAFGDVSYDTLVFFALNHSGPNSPSGFDLTSGLAVVTDAAESLTWHSICRRPGRRSSIRSS